MHREFNSPTEIRRRLIFVLFLSCCICTLVMGVIGLVKGRLSLTLLALLSGGCSVLLKQYGEQALEFQRLARSFPFGIPEDELPEDLRLQLETLFEEFHSEKNDWQKRVEIRNRLAKMVKKNPDILNVYPAEIKAVHPKLKGQCTS